MTISFTDLFTQVGKLGKSVDVINLARGTTIPTAVDGIFPEYVGQEELIPSLETDLENVANSYAGFISNLQVVAQNTVIETVNSDNPQPNTQLATALEELIAQMTTNVQSIAQNTVSASTATGGSNIGTGVVNTSVKNNYGATLQMPYAEDVLLSCQIDGTTGLAGNESFAVEGEFSIYDSFNPSWPAGSGSATSVSVINAAADNSSGNLLTNSGFETFTVSNTPDKWSILSGSAGTEILRESSIKYAGTYGIKFTNGTDPKIGQVFGNSTTGTAATLLPLTSYSVSFWVRCDSVPASGTMTVRLYDVTNTAVMTDASSTANQTVINLNTLTTGFVNHVATFRTPRSLPATYRIEVLANSIPASRIIYIDHLSLGMMTTLYNNGPSFAIHAGASNFIVDDSFLTTVSNSYASDWAIMAEKMFNLNINSLILPYSGSPTISDSLLS